VKQSLTAAMIVLLYFVGIVDLYLEERYKGAIGVKIQDTNGNCMSMDESKSLWDSQSSGF
jgi:hypothetical protein